jgi:hypothetical protein
MTEMFIVEHFIIIDVRVPIADQTDEDIDQN